MSTETAAALDEPPVLFERVGRHVAVVTLNRPAARNAVNGALAQLLGGYVRTVEEDPEIRVAILTAAGDKSFSAGADLAEVAAGRAKTLSTPEGGFAGFVYARRAKPWIAAVRSNALGGGLELSLACDMIVAGESAVFGLPEPRRGMLAGAGGVFRLPLAVPRAVALEMIATGLPISARRAYEVGLVNRVVADERVLDEAIALAESVIACAPGSVREGLAIGRIAHEMAEDELKRLTAEATARVMASEDAREGPRAFIEKRPPEWKG